MIYLLAHSYLAIAGLLKPAHGDSKLVAKAKSTWSGFKAGVVRSFEMMGQYPLQ